MDLAEGKRRRGVTAVGQCKWYPLCPMKRYHEAGKLPARWVQDYCRGDWENCVRYRLEERGEYHPDWMLPDGSLDPSLKGR